MKKRIHRSDQLSDGQLDKYAGRLPEVGIAAGLNSFTGDAGAIEAYTTALAKLKKGMKGWAALDSWLWAFSLWANGENSTERSAAAETISTKASEYLNGFARFVRSNGLKSNRIEQFDGTVLNLYLEWLSQDKKRKGRNGNLAQGTQKARYEQVVQLLKILERHPESRLGIQVPIDYPYNKFANVDDYRTPTRRLDDYAASQVYLAARREALEIIEEFQDTFNYIGGLPDTPPSSELFELRRYFHLRYPYKVPFRKQVLKDRAGLHKALDRCGGLWKITRPLQPRPRDVIPFVVLLGIYLQANTSPLLLLKRSGVVTKEVLEQLRTSFLLEKGRAKDYRRSFANDDSDPLSPNSLIRFLDLWCARLHSGNPELKEFIFCFVSREGEARSYKPRNDIAYSNSLSDFIKAHGLEETNMRELRQTGLAVIRRLFRGDDRAAPVAGGHSLATHNKSYQDDDTRLQMSEEVAELMTSQGQFIESDGRIDHRGAIPNEDVTAATPGWNCINVFDSPIAGQLRGKPCMAFGQCPNCALGQLNKNSPYSFGRVIQLRLEIDRSRDYLDWTRYVEVFLPVAEKLDNVWIPAFSKSVISAARNLNLTPIGRLE